MKIEYTYTDAMRIFGVYCDMKSNPAVNPTKRRGWEDGFICALKLCGVKVVSIEYGRGKHATNIYAPDGNEFPREQIDEYNRSNRRPLLPVAGK